MPTTIDYHQRSLGLTFSPDHQARFNVWAPLARKVAVSMPNGATELLLQQGKDGYWHAETDQISPGDLYTYIINDEQECADPASLIQPQGFYGPSEAFDTSAFYWEDAHWINPPIDEYIIYELDICSFTKEGTLKALLPKLSYLKKLGITAIQLRPVTPFLNAGKHQQTAPFLYAVQASCGGPAHLQQLVNACHFEGIAVILDLVYQRPSQPIKEFGNFGLLAHSQTRMTTRKTTLDQEASARYLIENMLMWFREFHIDAIQLTDILALPDADQLLRQMREHTSALTGHTGRQYYLLVEHELPKPPVDAEKRNSQRSEEQRSPDNRGPASVVSLNEGLIARRCQTRHYQESFLYDTHFSDALDDLFGRCCEEEGGDGVRSIGQTCFKPQNSLLETTSQPLSAELVKLMAGYIMVSPCIPTLFMGEEWGAMNPFQPLTQDESMPLEAVPESLLVDQESQSVSALPWEMPDDRTNRTLYPYYQSLTALRRQQPALCHLNAGQTQLVHKEGESTLVMHRSYKTNGVLCLMNFSVDKQMVILPDLGSDWQKLLDSADPVWGGPGSLPEWLTNAATVALQPESIVVYKAKPFNSQRD